MRMHQMKMPNLDYLGFVEWRFASTEFVNKTGPDVQFGVIHLCLHHLG